MSGHHIDFVAFDLTFEGDGRGVIDDPLAELLNHRMDAAAVHTRFLGDLQGQQIQPHEVGANDPHPQGLVMAGEDGPGQVVESPPTDLTEVALAMLLGDVASTLDERF